MKKITFIIVFLSFFLLLNHKGYANEFKANDYIITNIDKVEASARLNFPITYASSYNHLPGWKYDVSRQIMYFVPFSSKEILFIDPNSLKVNSSLSFDEIITDTVFVDDKIFVASGAQIYVIDPSSKKIIDSYLLAHKVKDFEVYKEKVLYMDDNSEFYQYVISEKREYQIPFKRFGDPVRISVHPTKDIVYIASSYEVASYNANTFEWIQSSRIPIQYSLLGNFYYDDSSLFYGARELNSSNISQVIGTFEDTKAIKFVNDKYVFTTDAVYNRETHSKKQLLVKMVQGSSDAEFLMNGENVYIYLPEVQTIVKTKLLNKNEENNSNTTSSSIMEFTKPITSYYHDKENKRIYLLFKDSNEMMVVNTSDMSLIKRIEVGSKPSDIKEYNGKIYISFEGKSSLLVMSKNLQSKQYIELGKVVSNFVIMNNTVFFRAYGESNLYQFNLNTNSLEEKRGIYRGSLQIFNNHLYLVEGDGSTLSYEIFDGNGEIIQSDYLSGTDLTRTEHIFIKNNAIYLGQHKIMLNNDKILKQDIQRLFYSSKRDYILDFVDQTLVTNLAVYDGNTRNKLNELPEEAKEFTVDLEKNGYLITKDGKEILKLAYPYKETPRMRRIPQLTNSIDGTNQNNFPDMLGSFAKNEVQYLADLRVINGYPNGSFRPKQTITNMEAAIMLARAIDLYGKDVLMPKLVQIPNSNANYDLVMSNLYADKDPIFKDPSNKTTRKEMAQAIYSAFGLKGSNNRGYKDITNVKYKNYVPAIESLSYHGITNGYLDGTFQPDRPITRDEFAAFLARVLNEQFSLKK